MRKKVAVAYLRVSTEDQTLNYSLDYQDEHIRKYCEENDIHLKNVYNEGFGSGGNVADRPVFQMMMREALTDSEIDYVIVLADHRFSRNHADTMNLVDRLRSEGKNLICVADKVNTENANDFEYLRYKSIHSERTRNEINFNCMYGLRQRAKNGFYSGGKVTGYSMINGELKVDPERKVIVEEIFKKCAYSNWGYKKIAIYLNTIGYKTVHNEEFHINAVKTILSNPIYIGLIRFEGNLFAGQHEPLINKETWEIAQKNMMERSYMPVKIHSGSYFLSGLLKCPQCGGSMVHHKSSNRKYHYYQCLVNKSGKTTCSSNLVDRFSVEENLLLKLTSILQSPSFNEVLLNKLNFKVATERKTLEQAISYTQSLITKKEKEIARTYDLYYKTDNDIHRIQIEKIGDFSKNLNERLESTIKELQCLNLVETQSNIMHLINNFPLHFRSMQDTKQKEILQAVIKEIHVSNGKKPKDKKITNIVYHVAPDEIIALLSLMNDK